jgi:hypothetical protein
VFSMFKQEHGRWPDLLRSATFSDRMQRRKLFDRNPMYTTFTDKVAVRAFVSGKVGDGLLVPRLWEGNVPASMPFATFPYPVIVKPSHLSGWMRVLREEPKNEERSHLLKEMDESLLMRHGRRMAEPAYDAIPPKILVEPLLQDEDGEVANDYKFYVFHGRATFIHVIVARFSGIKRTFYDREWQRLEIQLGVLVPGADVARPATLDRMLEIAEVLASGFAFLRVDLYEVGGRIYFGELTVYPESGLSQFRPPEWDRVFGDLWRGRTPKLPFG